MTFLRTFKYNTFTKKCEELLIVLHDFYAQYPERVFVRDVGGGVMPFVWATAEELISAVTYQRNSFFTALKFLVENGIIVVRKPDFVKRKTTNCYAINYKVLETFLKGQNYVPCGIRPHSEKMTLTDICQFDPMHIIRKVPGFKQKVGRYKGRKCVTNPKGNCNTQSILLKAEPEQIRHLQTVSNPLRGYLYHIRDDKGVDNSRLHARQRYGGARYAALCQQEAVSSLGELIYTMGVVLEEEVHKGTTKGYAPVFRGNVGRSKRWVDIERHKKYFTFVGAIFEREIFRPTRENFRKLAAWAKENLAGNLTEALRFKNLYMFARTLIKPKKDARKTMNISQPVKSMSEKMEELQRAIGFESTESLPQKEARLALLAKMGPDHYATWIKDLPFEGESDYCFHVNSQFHKDYLNNKYSYDQFQYDIPRQTLQLYR
jgi:hypothetical protein